MNAVPQQRPSEAEADRRSLEADLRRALAQGELTLNYQPLIDAKTRRIAGFEALLRWQCPGRGWIAPDWFVPLAEELGLIEAITEWVLQRAARELGPLLARHPEFRLSVNLPAREVLPERVEHLLDLIADLPGLAAARLELEITERTLLGDSPAVHAALAALAGAGVSLAIDDFGTGYSSLSYLDRYPISRLKIDKSFVQRLATSPRSRKLTEAILLMSGALEVDAVGEGVETIDQLAFLIGKGCRFIQGYLFSRPLPIGALEAFVAAFRFPDELLDAALWPQGLSLPPLLADNQDQALRLFVEHVPAAVAMFDTSMRYVAASARWISQYELAERNLIGRCHYEVEPQTPRRWRDVHARCLAGAVERCEEDCYVRPDGRTEWVRWEVRPFHNGIGDVAGIIVFSERITERKEAEHRHRESEQRLADFLAAASDWLWETDTGHRLVARRDHAADQVQVGLAGRGDAITDVTVGWGSAADIGCRRWELRGTEPGQDELWRAHRAELHAHRPFRDFVYARRTIAGELAWIESSGHPRFDQDGVFLGYRGTARNITARKQAEATLRAHAAQLELASEMAGLGYWQIDLVRNRSTWSAGMFRIAGREQSGIPLDEPGRLKIFHPDDRAMVAEVIRTAIATGEPFHRRARVVRPDGSVREVVSDGRPQFAEDGRLIGLFGVVHDITGQLGAAAALARTSEENAVFRAIIESLPDHVYAKDRDGRFIVANAATVASFGLSRPEQLIGKCDHDFHPRDLADRYVIEEQAVMREGRPARFEHLNMRNGAPQIMSSVKAPHRDAEGRVIGLVGINRDISDLHRTHRTMLARSRENELYRRVIESLPDAVFVKDRDGRFLLANGATARAMGAMSGTELLGRHDSDYYPPDLVARFVAEEREVLATGKARVAEQRRQVAAGRECWKLSSKSVIRDEDGRVFGIIGVERDISDIVRAREDVARERLRSELYRAGIEKLPDLFYVKDLQHRFLVANRALAQQVGAGSVDDVIGKTDADFHEPHLADMYREEEAAVLAAGEIKMLEQPARRADGTPGWFASLKAPLRDADGVLIGLVGHGRDITEQKQSEVALQRQTEELRNLAAAVEQSKLEAERVRDMLVEAAAVVSDGFAMFDPEDRLLLCNEAFAAAYGAPPDELAGQTFTELQCRPEFRAKLRLDDAAFAAWLEQRVALHRAATGKPNEWERDGRWHLVQERRTKDGSIVLSRADVTHLKRVEEDLRYLATRDALTGLSNRRDFVERGSRLMDKGLRGGRAVSLLLFDIDHFKQINDTYGHPAGDEVLRQISRVCVDLLRPTDLLARWGGEEFVQLLSNRDAAGALQIAERLRRAICDLQVVSGSATIHVTASFGLAIDDGTSCTLDELIEQADRALYQAKHSGRNRIVAAAEVNGASITVRR